MWPARATLVLLVVLEWVMLFQALLALIRVPGCLGGFYLLPPCEHLAFQELLFQELLHAS